MRRATVLVLAFYPFLGTTSPAAQTSKPLKTQETSPGTVVLSGTTAPLPNSYVIQPLKQHFEYILPGSCVSAIEKTPEFKCKGPDKDHLKCEGISLTIRGKVDECLEIHVEKEK